MAGKIRVLLIDDSGFMRIVLSDMLRSDGGVELVATASNGLEGVEKTRALKPDVVITDMIMPNYNGLYVVKTLMDTMPLPIILMSSLDRTDPQIFDALTLGAFDFIDKPRTTESQQGYPQLITMIREASHSDYIKLRSRAKGRNASTHSFEAKLNYDIIAIGASTGGPSAVEYVVCNIPRNLSIPVIIAQHMPERFIETYAVRLAAETGLPVGVAREGMHLMPGHIYLSPGTSNIRIENRDRNAVVRFVNDHYHEFNCPSVDCLFESVAEVYGKRGIGVVLTGMGKDGTAGLSKMKSAGALTIAQDEATSVVYGMPKSAFDSGAALHQLPLSEIPNFIISGL
jgi:two-component system chemotaxis response regulator CheB